MRSRRKLPRDLDYGFSNPQDPRPRYEQPADIEGRPIRNGDLKRAGEVRSGRTGARLALLTRLRELVTQLVGNEADLELLLGLICEAFSERGLAALLNWEPSTTHRRIQRIKSALRKKLDDDPKLTAEILDLLEQLDDLA